MRYGFLFLSFSLLVSPVAAQTNWQNQFAGLDGVALSCLDHSDGGYGGELCSAYLTVLERELGAAKVPFVNLGSYRPDGTEPSVPDDFGKALNVRLFIRGTAGEQVAIQLRARASVTYAAAVEAGDDAPGRSGELVIWENAVTGSGPSAPLRDAISQAIASRSQTLLENLAEHWPGE